MNKCEPSQGHLARSKSDDDIGVMIMGRGNDSDQSDSITPKAGGEVLRQMRRGSGERCEDVR